MDYGFIGVATFGASVQEVVHWYNLRAVLHHKKYQRLLRSKSYWILTLTMALVSGVGSWLMYGEEMTSTHGQFILGAAFPLLFKKAASVLENPEMVRGLRSRVLRYYLMMSKEGGES